MKAVAYSLLALFSLFLVSCGGSSGVDPHLSLEEQQEATEINLVGKWKIRRPQPIGTSNKLVFLQIVTSMKLNFLMMETIF